MVSFKLLCIFLINNSFMTSTLLFFTPNMPTHQNRKGAGVTNKLNQQYENPGAKRQLNGIQSHYSNVFAPDVHMLSVTRPVKYLIKKAEHQKRFKTHLYTFSSEHRKFRAIKIKEVPSYLMRDIFQNKHTARVLKINLLANL